MKERPILFTENIDKILDGTKTQTRRIVKPQPTVSQEFSLYLTGWDIGKCPYGKVGDKLWVRETFCKQCYLRDRVEDVCYKEDCIRHNTIGNACSMRWQSGYFMNRWMSRIDLEITEVRVERLQEITDSDCEKEGLDNPCGYYCDESVGHVDHQGTINNFAKLWNSINAKRSYNWESNPWVWAISFRRINGSNNSLSDRSSSRLFTRKQ